MIMFFIGFTEIQIQLNLVITNAIDTILNKTETHLIIGGLISKRLAVSAIRF